MTLNRLESLAEGKSKILYTTSDPETVIQFFKDDATAGNGAKKGQIVGKGPINNSVSTWVFRHLEKSGVSTHFIEKLSDREMLVKKLRIIPIEMVVRNLAAGSICKRLGIEKGTAFNPPLVEFFYKDDALGDPLISERHIKYFGWATEEQLGLLVEKTLKVNEVLSGVFSEVGLSLVDFKLEFGTDAQGNILLGDEFTGDGCRLWDKETGKPLDKDRFRQDLGEVEEAYQEVYNRLKHFFEGGR